MAKLCFHPIPPSLVSTFWDPNPWAKSSNGLAGPRGPRGPSFLLESPPPADEFQWNLSGGRPPSKKGGPANWPRVKSGEGTPSDQVSSDLSQQAMTKVIDILKKIKNLGWLQLQFWCCFNPTKTRGDSNCTPLKDFASEIQTALTLGTISLVSI